MDHLLEEMKTRFTDLYERTALGLKLVPSELENSVEVNSLKAFFQEDMPSPSTFDADFQQWKFYWTDQTEKPTSLSTAIKECDIHMFENISTLLKICGTFPLTSCECERSISVLIHLKTYLRSTMGQQRKTSLALMFIHRAVKVLTTDIVREFARKNPRKMELPSILIEE
ncbi:52 kDa repressor of the inhibitor of the protein kinase-like [Mizuhopecten yessoensis]|uniref:52 kDa repressor of the inhibitor of the protein kinase-like n=1 Tax=Mizuhopecten yessoensis TaxID=6573 RepID=UPI000B45AE61|nr:52 kDa repressor of the inhibitor of the protein kinase-like [Mizuhopecten yessoensis]